MSRLHKNNKTSAHVSTICFYFSYIEKNNLNLYILENCQQKTILNLLMVSRMTFFSTYPKAFDSSNLIKDKDVRPSIYEKNEGFLVVVLMKLVHNLYKYIRNFQGTVCFKIVKFHHQNIDVGIYRLRYFMNTLYRPDGCVSCR